VAAVIWICCCGVVPLAVSCLGMFVNSISMPLDGPSSRRFLKKAVKKRGVDPTCIPERVWWEIVEESISTAKNGNFRGGFARQLNQEADAVARIMSGTTAESRDRETKEILVRNGVIAPY